MLGGRAPGGARAKARSLEDEGRRLRYYGRVNEAARAEDEARKQWRLIGVETSVPATVCLESASL